MEPSSPSACLNCGRSNPPDAAFCNGCGQGLAPSPPPAAGPPEVPTSAAPVRTSGNWWSSRSTGAKAVLVLGAVLLLAVVGAFVSRPAVQPGIADEQQTASPRVTPNPSVAVTPKLTATPIATATPVPTVTARPTLVPTSAPAYYRPGDTVTLTNNGEPLAMVSISKLSFVRSYPGDYYSDLPDPGNVYVQMWVTYTALVDGVNYNALNWSMFVDGSQLQNTFIFLMNGPKPTLGSGTLPKGRKASGWLLYEIGASGQVVLSYQPNLFSDRPPLFEYLLRSH